MWYVICFFAGVIITCGIMGILASAKMRDYEERFSWKETQLLRLQGMIDHASDRHNDWEKKHRDYLEDLAYSDDVKEKT